MMLRVNGFILGLLSLVIFLASANGVLASDVLPDVVVFYRDGCNDCRHMDDVLEELQELYPELVVVHIEEGDSGAADLMWSLSTKYGIFPSKFPLIFVGDRAIVGIGRDKELLLRSTVRDCIFNECDSPIARINEKPFPWMTVATILVAILVLSILLL
ncbi:MAG: thioredoxin family protein [Candidatus Bipolaricaulota bacterium]